MTGLAPERIEQRLRERFPGAAIRRQSGEAVRDVTLYVPAERLVEIATFLRDEPECDYALLSWISGLDWLPRDPRFEVVYGLLSISHNARLTLKVEVNEEQPRVPSVVSVWPTADWLEREQYDLMGIQFDGHPNLARLLMEDDWEGHPLRKDYPIGGEPVRFSPAE